MPTPFVVNDATIIKESLSFWEIKGLLEHIQKLVIMLKNKT
jgi:hypothetical protein